MSLAAFVLATAVGGASDVRDPVGTTYRISRTVDTATQGPSTSSAHDADAVVERVVAVRADGVELVYDFPDSVPAEQRKPIWQLPVRVLRTPGGALRLIDRAGLEARARAWLAEAKVPQSACGQWYFTWNAFRIECDPDSALKIAEGFQLGGAGVREGGAYVRSGAIGGAVLTRKGATLVAELRIDPEAVHRDRAEADVVVGTIMHKPVTYEVALRERAKERVSGTVTVTFDLDAAARPVRRTTMTRQETVGVSGDAETRVTTEVLEREGVAR